MESANIYGCSTLRMLSVRNFKVSWPPSAWTITWYNCLIEASSSLVKSCSLILENRELNCSYSIFRESYGGARADTRRTEKLA